MHIERHFKGLPVSQHQNLDIVDALHLWMERVHQFHLQLELLCPLAEQKINK